MKIPIPHPPCDCQAVSHIFSFDDGFVQSHPEQVHSVVKCADDKIDLKETFCKVGALILRLLRV